MPNKLLPSYTLFQAEKVAKPFMAGALSCTLQEQSIETVNRELLFAGQLIADN